MARKPDAVVKPEDYEAETFTVTEEQIRQMFRRVFGAPPPSAPEEES